MTASKYIICCTSYLYLIGHFSALFRLVARERAHSEENLAEAARAPFAPVSYAIMYTDYLLICLEVHVITTVYRTFLFDTDLCSNTAVVAITCYCCYCYAISLMGLLRKCKLYLINLQDVI